MTPLELRAHQTRFVALARTRESLALWFPPGRGKTAAVLRALAEDFNVHGLRNTLIFAPISVCQQWPQQAALWTKIPPEVFHVLTNADKRDKELGRILERGRPAILLTNYESTRSKKFYEKLLKFSPRIVVLDESHRIKDSKAKASKDIYPLCQSADRRFLLTGTPAPNSLLDLFGQYKALDPGVFGPGFWSFRSRYFYDRNAGRQFSYPEWVPHDWAAEEIGKKLSETAVQMLPEEELKLPPLTLIPVACEMSDPQARAYGEMKKHFMTEVAGKIMSSEFEMTKTLRMQQVLAGFAQPDPIDGKEQPPAWFDDLPRMDALMDRIESIGAQKQIIWTVFRPTYQRIGKELEKRGISHTFLTGEQTTDAEKQANKRLFVEGTTQILIANPAAAGEGIDGLQIAQYAHFYMRGFSALHYSQALARNHRSGSERHATVIHYHYFVRGTLDEVVAQALLRKENVQERVLQWARTGKIPLDVSKGMEQVTGI